MSMAQQLLDFNNDNALALVCDRQILRNALLVHRVSFLVDGEPLDSRGCDGPATRATAHAANALERLKVFRQATEPRARVWWLDEFLTSCCAVVDHAYRAAPGRSWEGPWDYYQAERLFLEEMRCASEGRRLQPIPQVTQPLSLGGALRIAQESRDTWDAREQVRQRQIEERAREWQIYDEEREYQYAKRAYLNSLPDILERLYEDKGSFAASRWCGPR